MSTTDDTGSEATFDPPADAPGDEDPSIEIDRAYDEREDPTIMTVFPADAEWPEIGTTWISVDVEHAVPVSDYR
ncbi:hypothetical protein [Halorhabdus amylolytica]|uniref:hypothetical protein n=1 Tax=Halorhabdus amylolytica TaxID=2559573 RepID=UPI0010AAB2DE|nr:hypothetical protein [Halorhabdus amylolytica]